MWLFMLALGLTSVVFVTGVTDIKRHSPFTIGHTLENGPSLVMFVEKHFQPHIFNGYISVFMRKRDRMTAIFVSKVSSAKLV